MKNKLHRFLTVTMAVLVLLSSTGFAFVEHQCLVRGTSVQLVAQQKNKKEGSSCCARAKAAREGKGTFFKKTDCCKETQRFENLKVASFSQMLAKSFKALAHGTVWTSVSFLFLNAERILPPDRPAKPDQSFSSLFHGRSMLAHIQSFLI
ncbi:HYC_CC_PP family protein [Dyadobacter sandarakinus]|uniref:Secreted protein n=1 Tax=Dyadobacter sandarakinus TaxID=2747268 RepID=A0ABX7I824_9BACT|nr:hypothetical protein [Dyadobacter sandarakinus]QRR02075.1 hypothetical protein HWI92_14745 [Dyadobacter sandarakinus]